MKIGYMTNAFGPLVGSGGGVTSVKDIRYLTMCDDEDALRKITDVGFHSIEVLEGNLTNYASDPAVLKNMLKKYNADMMSVCVGANFIYPDALEDEMCHIEQVAQMGQEIGLTYVAVCGGAIRGKGIQPGDVDLLAKGLDELQKVTKKYGLTPCFHPHLGSIAEKPEQIDELFAKSDIPICPDMAHLQAGGYDPVAFLEKYYDRVAFVHIKDWDGNTFVPMGCGQVDNAAVIDWLLKKGYDGDWLVECDGCPMDPVEACRINYEFLKGKLI